MLISMSAASTYRFQISGLQLGDERYERFSGFFSLTWVPRVNVRVLRVYSRRDNRFASQINSNVYRGGKDTECSFRHFCGARRFTAPPNDGNLLLLPLMSRADRPPVTILRECGCASPRRCNSGNVQNYLREPACCCLRFDGRAI